MWEESQRYPDPRVVSLDPSFDTYRISVRWDDCCVNGFF